MRRRLPPLLLVAALGSVYLATLLPGVGHNGDTAEMQYCGHLLGVPHPTGYPTYLALNHALTSLLPIGSLAWRANLLSALLAIPACLYLFAILRGFRVREVLAAASAAGFGLTPTFWRHAVIAEVYTLRVLFLLAVSHYFLRWARERRERDFSLGTALYALSFGNHLGAITLLPALVWLVGRSEPRSFVSPRRLAVGAASVAVGAAQYAYLFWRSADPTTPYLYASIRDLAGFWGYVSGSQFHDAMFAFSPAQLLAGRLPLFLGLWWGEFGPLLALAFLAALLPAAGGAARDRAADVYLLLAGGVDLLFALSYDIPDVFVYFLPSYAVTAIFAGRGLEALAGASPRSALALGLAMPVALFAFHLGPVREARGVDAAQRARRLLERVGPDALLIAGYHEYQFLLYLTLGEGRGGPGVFVGHQVSVEEVQAYLAEGEPIFLPHQRRHVPPGRAVYSAKLNHKPLFLAAGLEVEPFLQGIYRVSLPEAGR